MALSLTNAGLTGSHTDVPRPEYPRPQFVRKEWLNLNGLWDFAFDDEDQGLLQGWAFSFPPARKILVPFPYQTELSGINDKGIHEIIWYSRDFELPQGWAQENVLLHFGAVDYQCTLWINGQEVGHNQGGHVNFEFNIAPYLNPGKNRLTLRVVDTQSPTQPRGKQSITGLPHDIDYYCTSGIWQTVWIEPVGAIRIEDLRIRPIARENQFEVQVFLHAPSADWRLEIEVLDGDFQAVSKAAQFSSASVRLRVHIPNARLWSPEDPHLYRLRLRLLQGGEVIDEIESYAGLRDIELREGFCWLNGEKRYLQMVLDQGYWRQSNITAPSDEALRADVQWAKRLGFNGVRKHQKFEDPRWLYWCDVLGLMVWEEMPNARAWSSVAEERLAAEWQRALVRDYNHPSIIAWVPVNESMGFPELKESHPGQYAFIERMVALTRRVDADRPVIDNDGWEHSDITDLCAIHDYTPNSQLLTARYAEAVRGGALPPHVWIGNKPLFVLGSRYRGQPVVLSEVGGFLQIPRDVPPDRLDMLYQFYGSWREPEELVAMYHDLISGVSSLPFVCGYCYTQLTDVEQETNGLLTYDREPKADPAAIAAINREFSGKHLNR